MQNVGFVRKIKLSFKSKSSEKQDPDKLKEEEKKCAVLDALMESVKGHHHHRHNQKRSSPPPPPPRRYSRDFLVRVRDEHAKLIDHIKTVDFGSINAMLAVRADRFLHDLISDQYEKHHHHHHGKARYTNQHSTGNGSFQNRARTHAQYYTNSNFKFNPTNVMMSRPYRTSQPVRIFEF